MASVSGYAAPGFEAVRDEFARNLRFRDELGGAFAAYVGGRAVVDLWGGMADRSSGRPWSRDTLTVIFSCTKGLTAVCVLMLLDRGALALDAPVARYWPRFAAHGKGEVTVGDVLSHQSRLPAFRTPVGVRELQDHAALAAALADQEPFDEPAAARFYHAFTYGYLCAELVRRVDGRSLGTFFAEEVAEPLGLDAWIGLPAEHERRVSALELQHDYGELLDSLRLDRGSEYVALLERVYANPPIASRPDEWFNRRELHAAEIPAVGGIATARSVARLYACLANGGELDGVRLLSAATIALARRPHAVWRDEVFATDVRFGLGFELHPRTRRFGAPEDPYGHAGLGGSVGAAWPTAGVGYAYVTNRLSERQPDRRAGALLRALDLCLQEAEHPGLTRLLGARASRSWTSRARRASLAAQLVRNRGAARLRQARSR